jgi:hypothetical protein
MLYQRLSALSGALAIGAVLLAAPASADSNQPNPPQAAPPPAQAPATEGQPAAETAPGQEGAPAPEAAPGQGGKNQMATIDTGPSEWQGRKLRHPRGGKFYPAVIRWANLVKMVMWEKKIPRRFLKGVLAQIQQESAGDPNAVNNWDVNAARGTPSKGLLQVIAPTYRYYAKPGYRNLRYQTVPYTNLWAALEYVLDRYGKKKFKSWNRGYNQGY